VLFLYCRTVPSFVAHPILTAAAAADGRRRRRRRRDIGSFVNLLRSIERTGDGAASCLQLTTFCGPAVGKFRALREL
jgi:hypothetical protein